MGIKISELLAISAMNEGDVFEVEQADGVTRKLTKTQFRSLLFSDPAFATVLPLVGDTISFSSGSDFVSGAAPRWRVVPAAAYVATSPPLGVSVAFPGGATSLGIMRKATDYFQVGDPVRVEIGAGVFYYGIVDQAIEFGISIAGALMPLSPILSLAVGSPDMVKHVDMSFPTTGYNNSTTLVLGRGCQHLWRGRTGHLCSYSVSHTNTSPATVVNLQMNNAGGAAPNVSLTGVVPGAGASATIRGAWSTSALGTIVAGTVEIEHGELITVKTPTIVGSGDYLIVNMTFVVP
jgi:hypothetical protein